MVDTIGCVGNKIKTASGHYIDLANPDPALIDIQTIASALSKICRFGGHCPEFYSVAEHSLIALWFAQLDGVAEDAAKAIFLHDATEAYLGDVVKPLKVIVPEYQIIEAMFHDVIGERFGVDFDEHQDVIKKYDLEMLKIEKKHMWPHDEDEWGELANVEARNAPLLILSSGLAESLFLYTAEQLGI